MIRTIGAVVAGYVVMALLVFAGLSCAYLAIGADAAFRTGTYDVSGLWTALSFLGGLAAAIAGGWSSATIARNLRATKVLAGVVLLLGLAVAIPTLTTPPAQRVRLGSVSNTDAMMNARTPAWIALLNPVVGVIGVLIGGRLARPSRS